MTMVKKSISITNQQDSWIKEKVASGYYGNESEIIRELIREKQIIEKETPAEIEAIQKKLIEAEKSGFSKRTAEKIRLDAKRKLR